MNVAERTFVAWVEPIARDLRQSRSEVVAFARSLPPDAWNEPSALPGWTRKDVLAHLAGDTNKISAAVMRAAIDPDAPAPSYGEGEDILNARDLEARRGTPVDDLIAEIESDGETWLELMSRLDEDTEGRWPGFPSSLREYLRLLVPHDRDHLAEMRAGLETEARSMKKRTFAAWVQPFAVQHRKDAEEVLAFARSVPVEDWETPSGYEGWTCKDQVAHIGKGNDQLFQQLLRRVIAGDKIDTEIFRTVDTDGENARGVEERRGMSPSEVIAEFEEAADEIHDLLSQLTDEHEHLKQDDPPFVFKGFLDMAINRERHAIEHLKQIEQALKGQS